MCSASDNDPAGKDVVRMRWRLGPGVRRQGRYGRGRLREGGRSESPSLTKLGNSIPQSFGGWSASSLCPQFPSKPQDYAKARGLAKAFEKANTNPLVGDWRRKRTCDELRAQV